MIPKESATLMAAPFDALKVFIVTFPGRAVIYPMFMANSVYEKRYKVRGFVLREVMVPA